MLIVKQYFDTNKLSFNEEKCSFMLTGTHQSIVKMVDVRIHSNNESLTHVSMYLGMYIDFDLRWDEHINILVTNISSKTEIVRSVKKSSTN